MLSNFTDCILKYIQYYYHVTLKLYNFSITSSLNRKQIYVERASKASLCINKPLKFVYTTQEFLWFR